MGHAERSSRRSRSTISIHPSRVGWDPCDFGFSGSGEFQSTHPVWDGTFDSIVKVAVEEISIHPSRVGWDQQLGARQCGFADFNPPIPCGMGLVVVELHDLIFHFNPPIPCGMGLSRIKRPCSVRLISIHPSRVGWDDVGFCHTTTSFRFQSTHPVWDGTILIYPAAADHLNFNPPIPCGMGQHGDIISV